MFKKLNKKGFTLAELLIVVAIIGVLVAISIPIFTGQLKKARLATNQANARAAYAAAVAEELDKDSNGGTYHYTLASASASSVSSASGSTATTTDIASWQTGEFGTSTYQNWYITIDANGKVTAINYN